MKGLENVSSNRNQSAGHFLQRNYAKSKKLEHAMIVESKSPMLNIGKKLFCNIRGEACMAPLSVDRVC